MNAKRGIFALIMAFGPTLLNADELTFEEFQQIHADIVPQNETWKTIPWQTDLVAAQKMAVKEKKLIFIWAMDGHPLGCT